MNVAAAVSGGSADVGMGIRAAAQALGLDFVPIAEERYDLIIPNAFIDDPKIEATLELLHNRSFRSDIEKLGGYNLRDCGTVIYKQ